MDLSPGMWKGRNPALHTSEQKMQPRNEPQFNSLSIKRYKPDNFLSVNPFFVQFGDTNG